MDTLPCSSPLNRKRKSEEVAGPDESKRSKDEECEDDSFGSDSECGEAKEADGSRSEMFHRYQQWLLDAYGDLKKTKTITLKKYDRIVRTLRGLIPTVAENSKFRFWIRTKGFCLGPPDSSGEQQLLVSSLKVSSLPSLKSHLPYC